MEIGEIYGKNLAIYYDDMLLLKMNKLGLKKSDIPVYSIMFHVPNGGIHIHEGGHITPPLDPGKHNKGYILSELEKGIMANSEKFQKDTLNVAIMDEHWKEVIAYLAKKFKTVTEYQIWD